MSKILKNTTITDIELDTLGLTIPASGQVTIDVSEYLILASEDSVTELTTLINSGDVVVNDGTNDLSSSDGIKYIEYPNSPDNLILNGTSLTGQLQNISNTNVIYVDKNGNDSNIGSQDKPKLTIKAALDSITDSSASNYYVVSVGVGTFQEDPMTVPSFVTLEGNYLSTVVTPNNINSPLITQSASSGISNLRILDVTNNAGILATNSSGAGFCNIRGIIFTNCMYGYKVESTGIIMSGTAFSCLASNISDSCFSVGDKGRITVQSTSIQGNGTTTKALTQNGTGELIAFNVRDRNCNKGLETNGAGRAALYNYDTDATIPFEQNSTDTVVEISGGVLDATKVKVSNIENIKGAFYSNQTLDEKFILLSELSVGTPSLGQESCLGEGDSYVNGMLVYGYDGSTFTDLTANANDPNSSTYSFPNTSDGSCLYFTTAFNLTDPLNWYGLKMNITTAANLGSGDIVFEYWDGVSWTEFNHMSTQSSAPYLSRANEKFETLENQQVRFDANIINDWATNDPVSLGVNLYWVRLRIDSGITTAPVFNLTKIHTSRLEVNADGFQEMFGNARVRKKFPITYGGFQAANNSPANRDIYLSDTLGVGRIENDFQNNTIDRSGFVQYLPYDVDTSSPLTLALTYIVDSNSSGNIDFTIRWATSIDGEGVYESTSQAPSNSPNQRSLSGSQPIGSSERRIQKSFTAEIEIPEAIARNGESSASLLWLTIERNGSSDSYSGDASVVELALYYESWNEGGYTR